MNEIAAKIKALREERLKRGHRTRFPRPPKWQYPGGIERGYQAQLVKLVREFESIAEELIIPELPGWVAEADKNRPQADAADEVILDAFPAEIQRLIEKLKIRIEKQTDLFAPQDKAADLSIRVNKFNKLQWERITKAVLGVDVFTAEPWLAQVLESFEYENAALIKTLGTQSTEELEGIIKRGMRTGLRHEEIAKQIREKYGNTKARARVIGRDQVSKLNGQLAESRQKELGVKKYKWRNSQDERVRGNPSGRYPNARPSHWEREGKVFSWDKPPEGGHPGQAILCRCTAEPDLSSIFK